MQKLISISIANAPNVVSPEILEKRRRGEVGDEGKYNNCSGHTETNPIEDLHAMITIFTIEIGNFPLINNICKSFNKYKNLHSII